MTTNHDDDDTAAERAELTRLYELADDIMAAGFAVFPAWAWRKNDGTMGKAPGLANGHHGAHRDPQGIRAELIDPHKPTNTPAHAVRVVAFVPGSGGCGVLDCDVKHGATGLATARQLQEQYGWVVDASWTTPSGGQNVMFRKPDGAAFSNSSPWAGIDVRSDGGWVVAPGNEVGDARWEWAKGGFGTAGALPAPMLEKLRPAYDDAAPKATPAELAAFIEASPTETTTKAAATFHDLLRKFQDRAQVGSRHEALVGLTWQLVHVEHLNLRVALARIQAEWDELTKDEHRAGEVNAVAAWAVAQRLAEQGDAVVAAAEAAVAGDHWDQDAALDFVEALEADTTYGLDIVPISELRNQPRPPWLVKNIIRQRCSLLLFGETGSYKSFLMVDLACCVATGEPQWLGHDIRLHGPVLYVAAEGADSIAERCDAWTAQHGGELVPDSFHVKQSPAQLTDDDAMASLLQWVEHHKPVLVFFDTFSKSIVGSDESDNSNINDVLVAVDRIKERNAGITVILVHHPGHTNKTRERGASALPAGVDARILVERQDDLLAKLSNPKQKRGKQFEPFQVELVEHLFTGEESGELEGVLAVAGVIDPDSVMAHLAAAFKVDEKRDTMRAAVLEHLERHVMETEVALAELPEMRFHNGTDRRKFFRAMSDDGLIEAVATEHKAAPSVAEMVIAQQEPRARQHARQERAGEGLFRCCCRAGGHSLFLQESGLPNKNAPQQDAQQETELNMTLVTVVEVAKATGLPGPVVGEYRRRRIKPVVENNETFCDSYDVRDFGEWFWMRYQDGPQTR